MTIACETLSIIVVPTGGVVGTEMVVPAYTRSQDEFSEKLAELTAAYLDGSTENKDSVSIADFALYLLTAASQEPRFMEQAR